MKKTKKTRSWESERKVATNNQSDLHQRKDKPNAFYQGLYSVMLSCIKAAYLVMRFVCKAMHAKNLKTIDVYMMITLSGVTHHTTEDIVVFEFPDCLHVVAIWI